MHAIRCKACGRGSLCNVVINVVYRSCSTLFRFVVLSDVRYRSIQHWSSFHPMSVIILFDIHCRFVQCPSSFCPMSVAIPSNIHPYFVQHPSPSVCLVPFVHPVLSFRPFLCTNVHPPMSVHHHSSPLTHHILQIVHCVRTL